MKFKHLRSIISASGEPGDPQHESHPFVPLTKLTKLMSAYDKMFKSRKVLTTQLATAVACNDKLWAEGIKTSGLMTELELTQVELKAEIKEMFETNAALLATSRAVTTLTVPQVSTGCNDADFEVWAASDGYELGRTNTGYWSSETTIAQTGWNARAALDCKPLDETHQVDKGALKMVINALRRDARDGRLARAEMADALEKYLT